MNNLLENIKTSQQLSDIIVSNKDAIADREGKTELYALIDEINSGFDRNYELISTLSRLVANLSKHMMNYDQKDFASLSMFLSSTKLQSVEITKSFKSFLEYNLKDPEDLTKRAVFLSMIIRMNPFAYGLDEVIEKEITIFIKYPLLALDILRAFDFELASGFILLLIKERNMEFLDFYPRLIKWVNEGVEKAKFRDLFLNLGPLLNEEDKSRLKKFATKYNLNLRQNIEAIPLVSNINKLANVHKSVGFEIAEKWNVEGFTTAVADNDAQYSLKVREWAFTQHVTKSSRVASAKPA